MTKTNKLELRLPYDPAISLEYIFEENKKHYFKKIYTLWIFIAALFTIVKILKQI